MYICNGCKHEGKYLISNMANLAVNLAVMVTMLETIELTPTHIDRYINVSTEDKKIKRLSKPSDHIWENLIDMVPGKVFDY